MQDAVIAVAHPHPILERLDMHVRGLGFDGAGNQLIDQADDRGFAGEVLEPRDVLFGRLGTAGRVFQDLGGIPVVLGVGIEALEGSLELERDGDGDLDALAESRRHRVTRELVERIGHGEHRAVGGLGDRQGVRLAQELRIQPVDEKRRVGIIGGADQWRVEEQCQRFGKALIAY